MIDVLCGDELREPTDVDDLEHEKSSIDFTREEDDLDGKINILENVSFHSNDDLFL